MSFQFLGNTKKRATTHPSTATTQVPQKFRYIASTALCACEPLLSALEKLLQMTLVLGINTIALASLQVSNGLYIYYYQNSYQSLPVAVFLKKRGHQPHLD